MNDDGSASMATMLLLSHHAFRRDMARLLHAVQQIEAGDHSRDAEIKKEWETSYRAALHGHHVFEDTHMFPDLRKQHPELGAALDALTEQHHKIDPILDRGDQAFADLAHPEKAQAALQELKSLLDQHLGFEEAEITPSLRTQKDFPTPADDAAATMFAQGFAWSMHGIAPSVIGEVTKLLPEILTSKLPAAREEFEKRCARVWGAYTAGEATTSVPQGYV